MTSAGASRCRTRSKADKQPYTFQLQSPRSGPVRCASVICDLQRDALSEIAKPTAYDERPGRGLRPRLDQLGGAAIAAAVLWLTGAPESRVAITPQLGAVAGLDLAVRF
jgi:hypothetical protein